jgi:hypothetical protein
MKGFLMNQGFDKELYTKKIPVKNLNVGDILAHDVYMTHGLLVVKAGVELSEAHLKSLDARASEFTSRAVEPDGPNRPSELISGMAGEKRAAVQEVL